MIPGDFDYHLFGTHVRFGEGVTEAVGEELRARGLERPVVLTQDRIAGTPRYAALLRSLDGMALLERPGIPPHSSVSLIETIAPDVAAFGADRVVAVGGDSVADSAKALTSSFGVRAGDREKRMFWSRKASAACATWACRKARCPISPRTS